MNDQEIAQSIENYLLSSRALESSDHDHKEKKFYLSDMGKCLRMRWLKRKGIGSEFDKHVNWVFAIGQMYHDYVYKALEAQGKLLEAEESMSNQHFSGRFDGIVKDSEGKAILDIKSIAGFGLEQIIKGGEKEEYIAQVLSYLMLLKDQGRTDLEKAVILYVNKEPSDKVQTMFLQRSFYLTKPREKQLRDEMAKLVDYWEKDIVPPCTCPSWMKNYNAYQPFCEASEEKIKWALKFLADKKLITTKKKVFVTALDGSERQELDL